MNSNQINWNVIFDDMMKSEIQDFANGRLSGSEFYNIAVRYALKASPMIRQLLRSRGVYQARQLARKALSRRS